MSKNFIKKENVIKMLEKIIDKVKEDEVVVEGVNEHSESEDVTIMDSNVVEFLETGRFSIKLNLYDEKRRNYDEVVAKLKES